MKKLLGGYLHRTRSGCDRVNVNRPERWLSTLLGIALPAFALRRRFGWLGKLALSGLGAAFARRGVTGRCNVYRRLGVRSL